ncbi:PH domain-containing protein [uncultured Pseudokineococcus sp.]|uniref:PH domain-containing protein n=1 Tax=uncultured Pseudokineococcus sp. TaxID=1642928 RepID=UPI002603857A|nr:PH domain-containing protein [uncultured Pseudokineococcus sp.]
MTDPLPLRLDLAGLQEHYARVDPQLSPRARRLLLVLAVVAGLVAAVGVLRAVLADGLPHLLVALLPGVLLQALLGLVAHPSLRPRTRLSPEELDVRAELLHHERVPWQQVVRVRPAGRWEDAAHAELADGGLLPLPHVPPDDALRLAVALDAARERVEREADGSGAGG